MQRKIYNILCVAVIAILLAGCGSSKKAGQPVGGGVATVGSHKVEVKKDNDAKKKEHHARYAGASWVKSLSKPNKVTHGLSGHHLSLWASHGRYFKLSKNRWEWQRPNLYCTTEDLFTQTFVVPYLIPMLERAGAVVYTPRERDWQVNEVVIDNDEPGIFINTPGGRKVQETSFKMEYREIGKWRDSEMKGFRVPDEGLMVDGEMPFTKGTTRMVSTVKGNPSAFAEYTPVLPEEGDYAVYVSYTTLSESVSDAHYTVFHGGQQTEFSVNQQMGGGTWVYLGTFHFTKDDRLMNGVVVDNHSREGGKVTTDAVRFGGGMGNIMRADAQSVPALSGLSRANEGARYFCQWAGAPYGVYSQRGGTDDYADDINCRSMMVNWLAGGSVFEPDTVGLRVPIEMNVALHSDAGFSRDFTSIYGSLGICTTDFNNGKLATGQTRQVSKDLAKSLIDNLEKDMKAVYGKWSVRDLYDRNYSETRRPEMASAILEMFSHQSFPDMKLAHDPTFKFTLSRSVYKTILRYISRANGNECVIAPLTPQNFRSSLNGDGKLTLQWDAQRDPVEPTANPNSYMLYIAYDGSDYDNGQIIKSNTASLQLDHGRIYRFRVSAVNDGGESLPSEELAVVFRAGCQQIMVVNGFQRLASPQVVEKWSADSTKLTQVGFDILSDPGVSYGKTPAWLGYQNVFETSRATGEGPGTLGYCGTELEGSYVAGNDFNYIAEHVSAIASSGKYSVVSCTASALPQYKTLRDFVVIDLLLGNQRNDGYSITTSPAISPAIAKLLTSYHGGLLVSGSYVASDSQSGDAQIFLANRLHAIYDRQNRDGQEGVHGMGMTFDVYRTLNAKHYASTASDVLKPASNAFTALAYADGSSAAVAYPTPAFAGKLPATFVMGFPIDCIKTASDRNTIMTAIIKFLTQ